MQCLARLTRSAHVGLVPTTSAAASASFLFLLSRWSFPSSFQLNTISDAYAPRVDPHNRCKHLFRHLTPLAEPSSIRQVSGFLGSEVALAFLRKGHQIRATVRKDEQVKAWSDKYPEWKDAIEWFVVPDIAAPGALDRAVEGATRVVHTASPFRFDINVSFYW